MSAARLPAKSKGNAHEALEGRVDPVGFDLNGTDPYWELLNRDDELDYVWALEDPRAHGSVDYYEAAGYEEVLFETKETTRPRLGKVKPGEKIRRNGHILMARPKTLSAAITTRAQAHYDALESHVVDRTYQNVRDHFRGLDGSQRYMRVAKKHIISEAQPESQVE